MSRLALLLLIFACKKPVVPAAKPEPAAVTPPAPAPAPPPPDPDAVSGKRELPPPDLETLQSVARALSVRDPEPVCAEIEASIDRDPVATWMYVVSSVSQPSYAPMRAAGCLVSGHPEAAADAFTDWVSDEEKKGLGLLVLGRLDDLPLSVAERVVIAGLKGPLEAEVREAVKTSKHTTVLQTP